MSNPNPNTDANALTPPTREQFEQERVTRRAMLRRLGLTAGASLFGLMAADDLVRAALTRMQQTEALRGVADSVAVEFKNAGVALAQSPGGGYCGVYAVPCKTCPGGTDGNPPPPCTEPYCRHCQFTSDCDDCMAVAEYKHCNCLQTLNNDYPQCFDGGNYNDQCGEIFDKFKFCENQLVADQGNCNN